jgi:hypothetical protein
VERQQQTLTTNLYTVPASTTTVITSLVVTNTAASAGTFTIAIGTAASETALFDAAAAAFGSDDFELISSVTPTAASTSVNFTSLDPFKKLLVICKDVELATTGIIRIRLNNDSNGDNYLYNYFSTSANINAAFGTGFQATTTNTVSQTVRFLDWDKTVKIAMPELNANIPPNCRTLRSRVLYVRGNFLRNQKDSHDKYFPCVIFGVSSVPNRSPLFHIMMEDGGLWWRMPINAFCTEPGTAEEDIHNLVLWNSFSSFITVTKFSNLANLRMFYVDRNKTKVSGKYLFTLDWYSGDANSLDDGYSENPGQHKCGHVIQRDDGNFAIQPNNRIFALEPSFTTKPGKPVIHRLINTYKWDVEDAAKWVTEDSDAYHYEINKPEGV